MIDTVPHELAMEAGSHLEGSPERFVALEHGDNCATGQRKAAILLPRGDACTRGMSDSIYSDNSVDTGSLRDARKIRTEQCVDSMISRGDHSSARDVGTASSDKTHDQETNRYEVERILGHKSSKGQTFYRIKWKGYRRATWEPADNLDDCAIVLQAYQAKICQSSKIKA